MIAIGQKIRMLHLVKHGVAVASSENYQNEVINNLQMEILNCKNKTIILKLKLKQQARNVYTEKG